jgi:hypothetical protein
VSRVQEYRAKLRGLAATEWERYLTDNSGLPGPRGNIELGQAVADEAPAWILRRYARQQDEFLAFCGTVGLGRLLAGGDPEAEEELHGLASDSRWRVREAVAMALQRLGDADPTRLLILTKAWALDPSLLVRRAAIAGLCEPRLLNRPVMMRGVLWVLDRVTAVLAGAAPGDRKTEPYRVLRRTLGYCWSVAVAADPDRGFARFEKWFESDDPDVRWVLRENLKKTRMRKADPTRAVSLGLLLR